MPDRRIEIKVCGITARSEITILNRSEVDYAGFIFANSKRRITIEKATELAGELDGRFKKVGVFTEVRINEINMLIAKGVIDIVQLHSQDMTGIDKINAPVWVSVGIKNHGTIVLQEINEFAEGIHLDTYDKKLSGGTGRSFDWELLKGFETNKKVILAGGLDYRNIKTALVNIKADVVDLNSGAEIIRKDIRIKSEDLINKFIKEVRKYEKSR